LGVSQHFNLEMSWSGVAEEPKLAVHFGDIKHVWQRLFDCSIVKIQEPELARITINPHPATQEPESVIEYKRF
jgi:hypothetical protein